VTLGADGAVACDEASAWHLTSTAGRGAYPVGSGDAFVAGLGLAIVAGSGLVGAAGAGMAAGIANARVPGAGNLDPAAAAALLDEVTVSVL
jgi:tagatose 6-phosphate kinase